MKTAIAHLKSVSPYSQSRHINKDEFPALDKESSRDYEKRAWRERVHVGGDGNIFIPPMAFKNCLSEAAKYLSIQIPGKGKSTYTKHVESGVLVVDPLYLPIRKETIEGEWLFLPSDGVRGSGKRVDKCYPVIREWEGRVTFFVMDETVTPKVFEHILGEAGKFIGIGRFRPNKNGFYGRFRVESVTWN